MKLIAEQPLNRRDPRSNGRTGPLLNFVLSLVLVAGCSAPVVGVLAEGKSWQASCPSGKKLATDVRIDASGTFKASEIGGDLEVILRDAAARTAVCGPGHLRVSAFAGSSAGTATLFDGDLTLTGATEVARLRRIPGVQDRVVEMVAKNYEAISGLRGGSDVVGQVRLSGEYLNQLGPDYVLSATYVTDGLQNVGGVKPSVVASAAEATQLGSDVAVPTLSGADITIVGLGNRNGLKPTSRVTELLVAFYTALCKQMDAARCIVASDYTSRVGSGS